LSHVWIICDVYENDLPQVHLNEYADVHLNAYPNRVMKAKISFIAPILDPALRTAKVRLEVENPVLMGTNLMRIGMFVTATFHGPLSEMHATVPATAILHLHDRDWVYTPTDGGRFRRVEVVGGNTLPGNQQEVVSGLRPGTQVIANALVFQATVEQ
jgi:cobalt-zinc-cadmium efflux system membrane fusion protein